MIAEPSYSMMLFVCNTPTPYIQPSNSFTITYYAVCACIVRPTSISTLNRFQIWDWLARQGYLSLMKEESSPSSGRHLKPSNIV